MPHATYRYANYRTPLRVLPATLDQRFSRAGDSEPTQYFALHPLGAWAEFMRWAPGTAINMIATRLWTVSVALEELVEITFDNSASFGIAPERLIADEDYSDCQDLADELRTQGKRGMVVPSAALPGSRNIVLFGRFVLSRLSRSALDDEHLAGTLVADHARPPVEIETMFRKRRGPHAEYQAWVGGTPYVLREPRSFRYPPAGV